MLIGIFMQTWRFLQHEKRCSGSIVRSSDNSSLSLDQWFRRICHFWKHSCEIISNLDKRFRRKFRSNVFFYLFSSGAILFCVSKQLCNFGRWSYWEHFCEIILKFGPVPLKREHNAQRTRTGHNSSPLAYS